MIFFYSLPNPQSAVAIFLFYLFLFSFSLPKPFKFSFFSLTYNLVKLCFKRVGKDTRYTSGYTVARQLEYMELAGY